MPEFRLEEASPAHLCAQFNRVNNEWMLTSTQQCKFISMRFRESHLFVPSGRRNEYHRTSLQTSPLTVTPLGRGKSVTVTKCHSKRVWPAAPDTREYFGCAGVEVALLALAADGARHFRLRLDAYFGTSVQK